MLSAIVVVWIFLEWESISKPTLLMFLVSEEIEETSFVLTIISHNLSKHFSRRFCDIYDLDLMLLIYFCKFITFFSIDMRSLLFSAIIFIHSTISMAISRSSWMLFDIPTQKLCKKIVSTSYMNNLDIVITKKSMSSRQSSSLYSFSHVIPYKSCNLNVIRFYYKRFR